jgi:signal transduction histidine kinase
MAERTLELGAFLRTHLEQLLVDWERRIRVHPVARELPRDDLLDSLPDLLERTAAASEIGATVVPEAIHQVASNHAAHRLEIGYDLTEVLVEYVELRDALFSSLEREQLALSPAQSRFLVRTVDAAMLATARQFSSARSRKLRALERITTEALDQRKTLKEVLQRLIGALLESSPALDIVVIFLREGDRLVVRATVGMERDHELSLAVGEGFAGIIAATKQPLFTRDASSDPRVKSEAVRVRGTHALYGVPLLDGDEVVGVAYMGSREAYELAEEDMMLFRALTQHATAIVRYAQRVEQLEQAAHFREEFIGILGHDLKNPLQTIAFGSIRLLQRGELGAAEREAVMRVERASRRMARLVDDVLDLTRGRLGGGIPVQRVETCLAEVCRRVIGELEIANPERAIRFASPEKAPACADPERIAQCVSNLVANALAHGRGTIDVRLTLDDDAVRIEVHNEGEPVPPEIVPHLFEPFRRGGAAKQGGLGLGLYIVDQIARAHGGTVRVRSTVEDGTTFTLCVPRRA